MSYDRAAKTLAVCDTEPIAIEGIRTLLNSCADLHLVGGETSLLAGIEMVRQRGPALVLLDKAFGLHGLMDTLKRLRALGRPTLPIVWGSHMTEAEALRLLQSGARGVMRKTSDLEAILSGLRAVAEGHTWMEEALFQAAGRGAPGMRSHLTARELQVVELIEQGMKNRDIASALGIRPGTVKIHLKHIFEKTGIRGRYGLALTGLKEKGLLAWPTA